ncbi:MAG: 16S rRNA (adenine(1518)-N(6)/adenine(1519)-N(6))-dimethyltransferase RsmA [Candidatus Micrarchaeia archaeon]
MQETSFHKAKKSLGQNFLVSKRIAVAEAVHALGKNVVEIGPGYGMLTKELCARAKHVIAVEKDTYLYNTLLSSLRCRKLELINNDFFDLDGSALEEIKNSDIMISNIPYNLSSKVIGWLALNKMQALLCLQKEFVEHMLARPGAKKYSKLSVFSQVSFSVTKIMDVSKGNFRPMPNVDSAIIYLKPKGIQIDKTSESIISLLMQHKKKELRNAIVDSSSAMGISKEEARDIANALGSMQSVRVYKMEPSQLLETANVIISRMLKRGSEGV